MRSRIRTQTIPVMKNRQAAKPALSIKGKLSQMKEKAKEVNKKPVEAHGEGES